MKVRVFTCVKRQQRLSDNLLAYLSMIYGVDIIHHGDFGSQARLVIYQPCIEMQKLGGFLEIAHQGHLL